MAEMRMISAYDGAKEVFKEVKKIHTLSIILIVSPLAVIFASYGGANKLMASFIAVATAGLGGWFLRQSVTKKKYLGTKYNLR